MIFLFNTKQACDSCTKEISLHWKLCHKSGMYKSRGACSSSGTVVFARVNNPLDMGDVSYVLVTQHLVQCVLYMSCSVHMT